MKMPVDFDLIFVVVVVGPTKCCVPEASGGCGMVLKRNTPVKTMASSITKFF